MYSVYKISFEDGYAYVGQTKYPLEDRIRRHINNPDNTELSRRLTSEAYVAEVLYDNIPTFEIANQIESDEIFALEKPINISGVNPDAKVKHFGHKMTKRNARNKPNRQRNIEPRPGTYRCSICHVQKRHTEFNRDRSRFNGLCSRCRKCDNHRSRIKTNEKRSVFADEIRRDLKNGGTTEDSRRYAVPVRFSELSEETVGALIEDYQVGKMSLEMLADKYGLNYETIRKNFIKMGVKIRTLSEAQRLRLARDD